MKIAIVLGHELPFPPEKGGGVNSLLLGLCKGLVDLGHQVTAYSPSVKDRPDIEILSGVKHVRVKGANRRNNNIHNFIVGIPYFLRVRNIMEECDILSSHLLHGFLFTNFFTKAKVITHTIHRDPKRFLYLFTKVDRLYTATDSVTEETMKLIPLFNNKVKTIYNCVDYSEYLIQKDRIKDGMIRFLFVGRFSKDKGLKVFIEAFCSVAIHSTNIYFKTVGPMIKEFGGDEELVKEMKSLVKSQVLEDRVIFGEPIFDRKKLDALIQEFDIIVLPSIEGETLNMSILECNRLGRALLISDLPANKPLNIEGETGFFAKVNNQNSWETKIQEIATDVDKVALMGKKAYLYGRNNFSVEKIASNYINDFEYLLSVKP